MASALDQLYKLAGGLSTMAAPHRQEQKTFHTSILNDFESDIEGETSNINLDKTIEQYSDWYTDNKDKLSPIDLERYDYLRD